MPLSPNSPLESAARANASEGADAPVQAPPMPEPGARPHRVAVLGGRTNLAALALTGAMAALRRESDADAAVGRLFTGRPDQRLVSFDDVRTTLAAQLQVGEVTDAAALERLPGETTRFYMVAPAGWVAGPDSARRLPGSNTDDSAHVDPSQGGTVPQAIGRTPRLRAYIENPFARGDAAESLEQALVGLLAMLAAEAGPNEAPAQIIPAMLDQTRARRHEDHAVTTADPAVPMIQTSFDLRSGEPAPQERGVVPASIRQQARPPHLQRGMRDGRARRTARRPGR